MPAYEVEEREDGLYVSVPETTHQSTLMDQMVDVMIDWGVDTVFGMVGHSNLGVADAFYRAEKDGRLRYFGIRQEGAAAFAASGYAKLTGRPAACFSIAGPGATNLLTGLWDAKVDRVPVLALTGTKRNAIIRKSELDITVCTLEEIPITFGGIIDFNISNALAAIGVLHGLKLPLEQNKAVDYLFFKGGNRRPAGHSTR